MTFPVTFHRSAYAEFIQATDWYKTQRPDLGIAFVTEIARCISLIAEQPQLYAAIYRNVRRITTNRFPYGIYFRASTERVVVIAVFHSRRDPAIWQRRK